MTPRMPLPALAAALVLGGEPPSCSWIEGAADDAAREARRLGLVLPETNA